MIPWMILITFITFSFWSLMLVFLLKDNNCTLTDNSFSYYMSIFTTAALFVVNLILINGFYSLYRTTKKIASKNAEADLVYVISI